MKNFFYMGGYAFYIWSAYSSVMVFILVNAWISWRKWRRYIKQI